MLYFLKCVKGYGRDYDQTSAMVVRADSEREARQVASKFAWQDNVRGGRDFLEPTHSLCLELTVDGPKGVIIQSNNPG
jgi:hypothetical protein